MKKEIATFGMGCFWKPQALFDRIPGVISTKVGFMGDEKEADYPKVCGGSTEHAEVVQITFDKDKIIYKALLDLFWNEHDPTTKDSQGPDFGRQYRSVIFYHSEEQKRIAKDSLEAFQKKIEAKIMTEISPALTFFSAEEEHQKYYEKHGMT